MQGAQRWRLPNIKDFGALIGQVARRLLGELNARMSKPSELRFGTKGSVSVDPDKGVFRDYENNIGGGTLDLIEHKLGLNRHKSMDWLRHERFLTDSVGEHTNGGGGHSRREASSPNGRPKERS